VLTPKQENFCLAYIETGNATEAYRRSYEASAMSEPSVNRKAKECLDNGKIAARLAELRAPAIKKAQITLVGHLDDLKRLRDKADAAEKFGPAIQAEIARGKASGLYVDTVDMNHGVQEGDPLAALVAAMADRAKLVPSGAGKTKG